MKTALKDVIACILILLAVLIAIAPLALFAINRPETRQDRVDKAAEIIIDEYKIY